MGVAAVTLVQFAAAEDADELIHELSAEGYTTRFTQQEDGSWLLEVKPSDDRVVEMVDVYGGWLPGDQHLPDHDPEDD
jgi:hypothetical protein